MWYNYLSLLWRIIEGVCQLYMASILKKRHFTNLGRWHIMHHWCGKCLNYKLGLNSYPDNTKFISWSVTTASEVQLKFSSNLIWFSPGPDCVPKRCCRMVTDSAVTEAEAEFLQQFAKTVLSLEGGGAGGVSILDLHSGTLSKGSEFANFYKHPEAKKYFTKKVLSTYQWVE